MNIRDTFLADFGEILIFIDLSRVEDRFVQLHAGIWSGSERMLDLANSRTVDTHAQNAFAIADALGVLHAATESHYNAFRTDKTLPEAKKFKHYRQIAKMVTHGVQRALGARGMSARFFKINRFDISPVKCQKMIDAYLAANWEIRDFYFPTVDNLLMRDHALTNVFGRRIIWPWHRIDMALKRKAYSWLPQSECADLLNVHGWTFAETYIRRQALDARVQLQVHDEIILSSIPAHAYKLARAVCESLETPINAGDTTLSVPADLSIGVCWGQKHEFDKMPTCAEFNQKVEELLK